MPWNRLFVEKCEKRKKKIYVKIHKFIRFWLLLAWWFICHRLSFFCVFVARREKFSGARVLLSSIGYYSWNYVCKISILNACWIEKKIKHFSLFVGCLAIMAYWWLVRVIKIGKRMLRSYQWEWAKGNVKERICMLYCLFREHFSVIQRSAHALQMSFILTYTIFWLWWQQRRWWKRKNNKKNSTYTLKAYKVVRVEENKKLAVSRAWKPNMQLRVSYCCWAMRGFFAERPN